MAATLAGLVIGALFLRRQHRLRHPLLDLDLVRHPAVGPTLVVLFLTALLMGGSSLFFNLYLQEVQGLTPLLAAVWMLPSMVAMIAAANLGPLLTRRVSTHRVVVGMLTVMTTGFACYALLTVAPASLPLAALGGSLATFGIGAAFPLLMDSAISAAPSERAGAGRPSPRSRTSSASPSG